MEGLAPTLHRALHVSGELLIDLHLLAGLLTGELSPAHYIEVEVAFPFGYPPFVERVFDRFGVEGFGVIGANALDSLEDFLRWKTYELLDAAVPNGGVCAIDVVPQIAQFNDREMAAQASVWFFRFVYVMKSPFQLRTSPSLCVRKCDDFRCEPELGHGD